LNLYADIRVYNKHNHFEGHVVDVEYHSANGLIGFKAEIEKVIPVMLDKVSEAMWYMITGYDRENSLKIIRQMYQNKGIEINKVLFAILIIRHRTDLSISKVS
jgi:hypothetical protein